MKEFFVVLFAAVLVWLLTVNGMSADQSLELAAPADQRQKEGQTENSDEANGPRKLNWVEKMFSDFEYDFGVVAQGAKVEHVITITNLYKEDVTLSELSHSCGDCVSHSLDRTVLKSRETAKLKLTLDTKRFSKLRKFTLHLTASFDGTHFATARIPITAFIRPDIAVESRPTSKSDASSPQAQVLLVSYRGRLDWTIQKVRSDSPDITADLQQIPGTKDSVIEYDVTISNVNGRTDQLNQNALRIETNDQQQSMVIIDSHDNVLSPAGPRVVTQTLARGSRWQFPQYPKFGPSQRSTCSRVWPLRAA